MMDGSLLLLTQVFPPLKVAGKVSNILRNYDPLVVQIT